MIQHYHIPNLEEMKRNMNKTPTQKIEDLVREGKIESAQILYFEEQMKEQKGVIRL